MAEEQTIQVASSAADADENAGTPVLNGAYLRCYNSNYWLGWFFAALAAAQGATINSATLSIKYTTGVDRDSASYDVYGNDVDEAAVFTTGASNISGRTLTAATTQVTHTAVGTDWQAIDVTAIIQEIVSRVGYVAGNDVALVAHIDASLAGRMVAYDTDTANCAKLYINYTDPVTAGWPELFKRPENTLLRM